MKFSAQEEYGLRCLLSLAREGRDGFLTIPLIAKREGLTPSHVAKLLSILRQSGFIKSTRGQAGGYSLNMEVEKIEVGKVLEALGGRMYGPGFCERHSGILETCVHETDCMLRPLWSKIQGSVDGALEGLTIADILQSKTGDCNVSFSPSRQQVMA
ncbi:MAG: Rrf2 family transcriptional regulator [Armatimonadetes bacterium]|nr:Rrf2 family transcriptional regulator [Armatimonadota bacterium]